MSKPLVFKVNLVGEMAVGKTSIFLRLKDDRFVENMSTITIDRGKIDFEVNGKAVQIDLWDTAGSERFKTTSNNYFRGSKAAVYIYDVTDLSTLYSLGAWLQEVQKFGIDQDHYCFLVGNKTDLEEEIDAEKQIAETFQKEKGFVQWFEMSAKSGEGVRAAFHVIAEHLVRKYAPGSDSQTLEDTVHLSSRDHADAPSRSSGDCCK